MAGQPEQTARRPAIYSTVGHDLYLALIGYDMNKGVATIKAYLNPLVVWIWIAVGFFIMGSIIALIPDKKYSAARASVPAIEPLPAYAATNGNGTAHMADISAQLSADVEVEVGVARARLKLSGFKAAGWTCGCGRAMGNGDKFCASCGAARIASE
jgi:hypothetical protein